MRKLKELISINDRGMSIVMIVAITILLPNTVLKGLGIRLVQTCLYDVYIGRYILCKQTAHNMCIVLYIVCTKI